jgi:hypothetical protein
MNLINSLEQTSSPYVQHGSPKPSLLDNVERPDLLIDGGDLPAVALKLRDLLIGTGRLFERFAPVKLTQRADGGPPIAEPLNANRVIIEAHQICRPVRPRGDDLVPVTLPDRVARMYLELSGEWGLPRRSPALARHPSWRLMAWCRRPMATMHLPASGAPACHR